jgi:PAS domain S-box-containing protein
MRAALSDLGGLSVPDLIAEIDSAAASADTEVGRLARACAVALRRELDKSQRFLDTVETIIVGLDREGRVTLINRKGCEVLGYAERDLLGKSWFEACLGEDSNRVRKVFRRIMAGELEALEYFENEVVTRSGARRMVAWNNNYMRDSDGVIIGTLSAGEDITARKRAEERNERLLSENRRLTQRLFEVQEKERRSLARELHDELGQWLSAVQAHAQLIAGLAGDGLTDIRDSAEEIRACVDTVLRNVRRMILDLRPPLLDAFGLKDSLEELVVRWRAHHPAVSCHLKLTGRLDELDERLGITIYRIVQEALTNVANHADASHVRIEIRRARTAESGAEQLVMTIADDGRGIAPTVRHEGMGLLGMRERVVAVGGRYELESRPGEGVKIAVWLPTSLGESSGGKRKD